MPENRRTLAEAVADAIDLLETELRMVQSRLAMVTWNRPTPPRRSVADEWCVFALAAEAVGDDGGHLEQQILNDRRERILLEFGALRSRLTEARTAVHGEGGDRRRSLAGR